jgi:Family of unknown function (DUF695)
MNLPTPSTAVISYAKSYSAFWAWFAAHERQFFHAVQTQTRIEADVLDKISPALDNVKVGLLCQVGITGTTVELNISANGAIETIVFAEELVQAAPHLIGWRFTALKSATPINGLEIQINGHLFNDTNIHFYSIFNATHPDRIALTLTHNSLSKKNRSIIGTGMINFLDSYIGELRAVTVIDQITIIASRKAKRQLMPIGSLDAFLLRRQTKFLNKYQNLGQLTCQGKYITAGGFQTNKEPIIALIDTGLMAWGGKPSHPWIAVITAEYDGTQNVGMPDAATSDLLFKLENDLFAMLPKSQGYLKIASQTASNSRKLYFACQDFRDPAKVLYQLQTSYASSFDVTYEIYKDKYWQSMEWCNSFLQGGTYSRNSGGPSMQVPD